MPRNIINEAELKKIVSKYVRSVSRDPEKIPDIQQIITEAIKNVAPDREIDQTDITRVLSKLSRRPTINDRIIQEAAKQVVDQSAMDDLRHLIGRQMLALGKKQSDDDIDRIIQISKLDPFNSTLQQIRTAVQTYYKTGKPIESTTPSELRDLVSKELSKYGPVGDQDIRTVLAKYLEDADHELPFDPAKVQEVIQKLLQGHPLQAPERPAVTPIIRPDHQHEQPTSDKVKQGAYVAPKDPTKLTFFEKVRKKLQRYGIKSLTRGSRNWLTDHVQKASKPATRKRLIAEGETVADALVGKMFMYFYDAKTKKELPYWDKFPLVFIVDLLEDGWLGLNLHYLDRNLRMRLFDKLLQLADDRTLDRITKLRLSYGVLKGFSRMPEAAPCLKRYLSKQVRSDLVKVESIDWEIALFLPVEQFQKEKKETVWQRSKEKYEKARRKS